MKFGPGISEEKSFNGVDGRQRDGKTDDGLGMIRIAQMS